MGRKITLTESELKQLIKRVVMEQTTTEDITGPKSACRKAVTDKMLWEAKQWWIDRLSIVGTDGKRIPNINIMSKILYQKYKVTDLKSLLKNDPQKGKKYFKESSDLLMRAVDFVKNIKFVFESKNSGGGIAWVSSDDKQTIHIDCREFSNPLYQTDSKNITYIKTTLVHEMQHSIDEFLGYKEFSALTKEFGVPTADDAKLYWDLKPMTNDKITYVAKEPSPVDIGEKKYSIYLDDSYFDKEQLKRHPDFKNVSYNCNPTEVQSRYVEAKKILDLPVTVDLDINILRRNFDAYGVFQRNLFCWAARTDKVSLDTFMKNINLLVAKNKTNNNDQNIS